MNCGLHTIERLMRHNGLKAQPRRRRLPADTGARPAMARARNVLDRQFLAPAPNRKWAADFPYIWTAEGWLYVAAVLGLFSRRGDDSRVRHRRPCHGNLTAGPATRAAASFRPRQSVYERAFPAADGRARRDVQPKPLRHVWDNAAMESLFSSLKVERVAGKIYRTKDQARADVFDYIERLYNPRRRHSTIGYISPMEFEYKARLA